MAATSLPPPLIRHSWLATPPSAVSNSLEPSPLVAKSSLQCLCHILAVTNPGCALYSYSNGFPARCSKGPFGSLLTATSNVPHGSLPLLSVSTWPHHASSYHPCQASHLPTQSSKSPGLTSHPSSSSAARPAPRAAQRALTPQPSWSLPTPPTLLPQACVHAAHAHLARPGKLLTGTCCSHCPCASSAQHPRPPLTLQAKSKSSALFTAVPSAAALPDTKQAENCIMKE